MRMMFVGEGNEMPYTVSAVVWGGHGWKEARVGGIDGHSVIREWRRSSPKWMDRCLTGHFPVTSRKSLKLLSVI